ncbi:MAG TPA: right-handed parallel beta-helix repeat-containing protein [Bacteroidales bacterium]|nr:right-handed parallel beta-helix repeat-containing protein [Bacteroidales bacterium]
MKTLKNLMIVAIILTATVFTACEGKDEPKKGGKEYPAGSIVWSKDTVVILKDHYVVPKGKSLYIEEGVQIIASDTLVRPEFIVLGNLYAYGTAEKPIRFTVDEKYRNEAKRFGRYWGGIIAGYDSKEVLLDHVIIEYGGAQTTEQSKSFQYQLFKTETGEGVPGFHFCNTEGSFVVQNCVFRNNAEDHIYITGGKSIIQNNKFIVNGFDGGEAVNYKSDCIADIAYNLVYDANTNAFKFSNKGLMKTQLHAVVYNNTIVNTGWRRPKIKGGSTWLEVGAFIEFYNNLTFDCRHGVKRDTKEPEDEKSVITPNFYFASTQQGIDGMTPDEKKGQLMGANDIFSATPGDKNPNFTNFTIQKNVDVLAGVNKTTDIPQTFNNGWDFSLKSGSPAATGGITSFTRNFGTNGVTVDGKTYTSKAPSAYFGAYPVK